MTSYCGLYFCLLLITWTQTANAIINKWAQCPNDAMDSDCPIGWFGYGIECYRFTSEPKLVYEDAKAECMRIGARLVRINTLDENTFIINWIISNAQNMSMRWYTAGMMDAKLMGSFSWDGHPNPAFNSEVTKIFLDEIPKMEEIDQWDAQRTRVVYGSMGSKWGWFIDTGIPARPYICEARKDQVESLITNQRSITYGQTNMANLERAPCITQQPDNPWYIASLSADNYVVLECDAYGNPEVTYKWHRINVDGVRELIDPLKDTGGLISQTLGKLVLHDPSQARDSAPMQCEITNKFGSVLSRASQIVFGSLDEFEKQPRVPQYANAYTGIVLQCLPPAHSPADSLQYSFSMVRAGGRNEPVDSQLRKNVFVSQNTGKLCFSEVTSQDDGIYVCMISMQTQGSNLQKDSRKSPDIPLKVQEGNAPIQQPIIQDGFPNVKPGTPLKGDTVRIECFAYGPVQTQPLIYQWRWNGKSALPINAEVMDLGRVILIRNIQPEDGGTFTCSVKEVVGSNIDSQDVKFSVKSKPFYVNPPRDMLVDADTDIVITCEASGIPDVEVEWYRNSKSLNDSIKHNEVIDPERYKIVEGQSVSPATISIKNVQATDNAMFGCMAKNKFSTEFAYSQLRVFAFAPNFIKYPLLPTLAMVSTSVIFKCQPEGSPQPTIEWFFNGGILATVPVTVDPSNGNQVCQSKHCKLNNNNLLITGVVNADAGLYTCRATNRIAVAESSAPLDVVANIAFVVDPVSRVVQVGTTVDLPCKAVSTAYLDMNYAWFFEGYEIMFDRLDLDARRYELAQFDREYNRYFGTLRIRNIQFENEGNYTCMVQTAINSISISVIIWVAGPPGPCAGVVAIVDTYPGSVRWTAGAQHQSKILSYTIEAESQRVRNKWFVLIANITEGQPPLINILRSGVDVYRRQYPLSELAAFSSYRLRVFATNEYGDGELSPPSDIFTTAASVPTIAPSYVTGGGGKTGTLVIKWTPIPIEFYNGDDFMYRVMWRQTGNREFNSKIKPASTDLGFNETGMPNIYEILTIVVGISKVYTEYDAQVCTFNSLGDGPCSNITTIFSAPDMPKSTCKNVQAGAFNSSALSVAWDTPTPPRNEGPIMGYRIVYWPRGQDCYSSPSSIDRYRGAQRLTLYGDHSTGTIIGLDTDTYYCVGVQVFTEAGDGTDSTFFEQTTFKAPPSFFPTKVNISTTNRPYEVHVGWVGIQVLPTEESLDGYMIRYWMAGAPLKDSPIDIDCGLTPSGYIRGLALDTRYNLRVFGYSRGGVGTLSSPEIQFMLIPLQRCHPGAFWDGPDMRYIFICDSTRAELSFTLLLSIGLVQWIFSKMT